MNTLKKATVYGLAALSLLACKPGQDATEQKIDCLLYTSDAADD